MKYSEFKGIVSDMNYDIRETGSDIQVRTEQPSVPVALVSKTSRFMLSTFNAYFEELKEAEKEDLFYLVTELAKTPLEEREEEKRYRLKFENNLKEIYVLFDESKSEWDYYDNGKFIGNKNRKSIFTESELEHIDETGFVREEVTE
jgi:hypothetical protein